MPSELSVAPPVINLRRRWARSKKSDRSSEALGHERHPLQQRGQRRPLLGVESVPTTSSSARPRSSIARRQIADAGSG